MSRNGEHRVFALEEFVKNGEYVIATQRAFRNRFYVGRHGAVLDGRTICRWVLNFRETGSSLKRKSTERRRTARTAENVNSQRLRTAVSQAFSA